MEDIAERPSWLALSSLMASREGIWGKVMAQHHREGYFKRYLCSNTDIAYFPLVESQYHYSILGWGVISAHNIKIFLYCNRAIANILASLNHRDSCVSWD